MMTRGWPLSLALAVGCQGRDLQIQSILSLEGDPVAGQELFDEHCADCHGYDANPAEGLAPEQAVEQILYGGSESVYTYMPGFWNTLSDEQIADILAHLTGRSM